MSIKFSEISERIKNRRTLKQYISDKLEEHSRKYYVIEGTRKLIMLAALCVFTYASYQLSNKFLDYREGTNAYKNMEKMFEIPNVGSSETQTDSFGNTIVNSKDAAAWAYDFSKLKAMNEDAVGWIKQDNIISYPIVVGTDNTYYLTHNAAHGENNSGAIFLDYRVDGGLDAKNCIIYGHDMLNNSMFGTLIKYSSKSYCNDHPYFDIYNGDKGFRYYVFAAYETDEIGDTYSYNFPNDEEFQNYINLCQSRKLYQTSYTNITSANQIVTLSTCTRHNQKKRMIVQLVKGEPLN